MDVVILSRIQFAFTITFHIIWPLINVGLAVFLLIIEIMWLIYRDEVYAKIYTFWIKIFALSFAVGVVTGIVMSYQFGTNMSPFAEFASPVIGPLLGTEVLTAFFLEAVFIGIMVFGWGLVHPILHVISTAMVVVGVHSSVFWIICVISWMHTPSGTAIDNGALMILSWYDVIFNPSMLDRLLHMLAACYITSCLIVMGIAALYLLKDKHKKFAQQSFKVCFTAMSILIPLMLYLGDESGLTVYKHQPVKLAAMEGLWETMEGAPTILFGIPLKSREETIFKIQIPYGTSLINTHEWYGKILGLKEWEKKMRPPVIPVFFAFRIMVGIWLLMTLTWIIGLLLALKGKMFYRDRIINKIFLLLHVIMTPLGIVASIAGWYVVEIGRQPWVIYNIMLTKDAVSKSLSPGLVLWSLMTFVVVDLVILFIYSKYVGRLIKKGPVLPEFYEESVQALQAKNNKLNTVST